MIELNRIRRLYCLLLFLPALSVAEFPFLVPERKPEGNLSKAVHRNYDMWPSARPENNELFSLFKYTKLEGFDYNGGDGTITRRDPSKIILRNGKYYVWYTYRETEKPGGVLKASDTRPGRDWDLCEIWYATSEDGFTWEEQGVAIPRAQKPNPGWRSVSTTDVLEWEGNYYLYYQAFSIHPQPEGDYCPVAVSVADSPDGPWTAVDQVVIPNGAEGTWDSKSIHDPHPFIYKGKVYLYFKSDFNPKNTRVRMQGLATADHPLGPFVKHPQNPVLNSGHETIMFPFKEGIASILFGDGNEHFTVQYAPDGVNFEIASIVSFPPPAAGPYTPDAFADNGDGRGITWGLCHNVRPKGHSILMRFDCDLSLDHHIPEMKRHKERFPPEILYTLGLNQSRKLEIAERARAEAKASLQE